MCECLLTPISVTTKPILIKIGIEIAYALDQHIGTFIITTRVNTASYYIPDTVTRLTTDTRPNPRDPIKMQKHPVKFIIAFNHSQIAFRHRPIPDLIA